MSRAVWSGLKLVSGSDGITNEIINLRNNEWLMIDDKPATVRVRQGFDFAMEQIMPYINAFRSQKPI
jgi:hypothetical protein